MENMILIYFWTRTYSLCVCYAQIASYDRNESPIYDNGWRNKTWNVVLHTKSFLVIFRLCTFRVPTCDTKIHIERDRGGIELTAKTIISNRFNFHFRCNTNCHYSIFLVPSHRQYHNIIRALLVFMAFFRKRISLVFIFIEFRFSIVLCAFPKQIFKFNIFHYCAMLKFAA